MGRSFCPNAYRGGGYEAHSQSQSLPYSTDFSTSDGWTLENGECTNAWYIGKPANSATNALFVSQNGSDTTFEYDKPSVVLAKQSIETGESERITVDFDINVGGGYYAEDDYVKVYLVSEDGMGDFSYASTSEYVYSPFYYNSYDWCGQFNGKYGISKYQGHVSTQIPNPSKNSTAYLIFVWRNEKHYMEEYAKQPAPIITNLTVKETPDSEVKLEKLVFNFAEVSGETSLRVVWSAGRDEQTWQITLDTTSTPSIATENSYTFTDMTNHTQYTVYIRATKGNYHSDWMAEEVYFNTDPEVWTHGPSDLGSDFAVLTGALTWNPGLKPTKFGLTYRKVTESNWTYLEGVVDNEYDGQLEMHANASGLAPFTWYTVGAWAVTKNGDTITGNAEMAHNFLTFDNYKGEGITLPYDCDFSNDDYWGLTKGFYNWYIGKPSSTDETMLYISPNGTDLGYTEKHFVGSVAQKTIKRPECDYLTVTVDLSVDGTRFINKSTSQLDVVLMSEPYGGFAGGWYTEPQSFTEAVNGKITMYLPVPQPNEWDGANNDNIYLVLNWTDMQLIFDADYEFGDFAAIVKSISIEETPSSTVATFSKCKPSLITDVRVNSFTQAVAYWENTSSKYQYKLNANGEVKDSEQPYLQMTDLTPNTDYTLFVRSWCDDSEEWNEWVSEAFSTKALPELYTLPVEESSSSSAEVSAYLSHAYIMFNAIQEFGFEVTKIKNNTPTKADEEWTKLSYNKIDTVYDYGSEVLYKIYANIDNLDKQSTYKVREYAITSNNNTVYSNERTFNTSSGLNPINENTPDLVIFPNPAKDFTVLNFENLNSSAYLYVTDIQGKVLYKQYIANGEKSVNLNTSDFTSGVYYVRLQTQNGATSGKLIVK